MLSVSIGKYDNNKFCVLNLPKGNDGYLADLSFENRLTCLNTKFQKGRENYGPHHHHHHVMPLAWISQTLSRHFSLSFIASGRSSGLHPVSSQNCCMYIRAGRPAFERPYVGVHRSTSHVSSSPLLQQCPACLVRLTWIVFVMGGRWSYNWCLVVSCRQSLFNIARNILL